MIAMKDRAEARDLDELDAANARAEAALAALLVDERDDYLDGLADAARQALVMIGDLSVKEITWQQFTADLPTRSEAWRDGVADYFTIFCKLCAEIRAARTGVLRERISTSIGEMMPQAEDVDDETMNDWAHGVVADARELDDLTHGGGQ